MCAPSFNQNFIILTDWEIAWKSSVESGLLAHRIKRNKIFVKLRFTVYWMSMFRWNGDHVEDEFRDEFACFRFNLAQRMNTNTTSIGSNENSMEWFPFQMLKSLFVFENSDCIDQMHACWTHRSIRFRWFGVIAAIQTKCEWWRRDGGGGRVCYV